MGRSESANAPVSHRLTRATIQAWKNRIQQAEENSAFVEQWPCMYCEGWIDLNSLRDPSRFRCAHAECVGKGKLQVTCYWDVTDEKTKGY